MAGKKLSDQKGRLYASKAELKAGDHVTVDNDVIGFHCLEDGDYPVLEDNPGRLYIVCKFGKHHIDSHLDDSGMVYSGFYKVGQEQKQPEGKET